MYQARYLPHNELSDLKRQIAFNETMKKRVYENADKKAREYDRRNQVIAEKISHLEEAESK